jgi:Fe-S cluster assembly ATPase SufC
MIDGKIVKTGNLELVDFLEKNGYENLLEVN